jgi:hypothetical protein
VERARCSDASLNGNQDFKVVDHLVPDVVDLFLSIEEQGEYEMEFVVGDVLETRFSNTRS